MTLSSIVVRFFFFLNNDDDDFNNVVFAGESFSLVVSVNAFRS